MYNEAQALEVPLEIPSDQKGKRNVCTGRLKSFKEHTVNHRIPFKAWYNISYSQLRPSTGINITNKKFGRRVFTELRRQN